jgi:hypothetical protein
MSVERLLTGYSTLREKSIPKMIGHKVQAGIVVYQEPDEVYPT